MYDLNYQFLFQVWNKKTKFYENPNGFLIGPCGEIWGRLAEHKIERLEESDYEANPSVRKVD